MVDGLAGGQAADDLERLVQPAAPGRRIHAGVGDLAAVLAADPDAEDQPPGRELRDRRQLPRRHHRVPQAREVDTDEHIEAIVGGEHGRRGDQPVESRATVEADVVAGGDVVQADAGDVVQDPPPGGRVGDQQILVDRDADIRHGSHDAATFPSIAVAMMRFWIPAVPSAIR